MENNRRIWQNGRLWWNDPDTMVLSGRFASSVMGPDGARLARENEALTTTELHYHVASTFAVGGLVLTSDDLPNLALDRAALLERVSKPTGVPIEFSDDTFEVGEVQLADGSIYAVFNRDDEPARRTVGLPDHAVRLIDYLTDEDLGVHEGEYTDAEFPARFGRLLRAVPVVESVREEPL
jgi:alpha-galactosidase